MESSNNSQIAGLPIDPEKKPKGRGNAWRKGQTGKLTDKPVTQLDAAEKTIILKMRKLGRTPKEISDALDRQPSTIVRFLNRMEDTTELAAATLKAGAVILAERVIKKADVSQAIEVLSRPGIEALQPNKVESRGGGLNIQVSVGVASCGTVVGEMTNGKPEPNGQLCVGETVSSLPPSTVSVRPIQNAVEQVIEGTVEGSQQG